MLWNKQKLQTAVVACFVALTLAINDFSFASTELHPVLQQIRLPLNQTGIGVSCCNVNGEPPTVELLEDMHFEQMTKALESQPWWERFLLGWMKEELGLREEFGLGKIGIIAAVNDSEQQSDPEVTKYHADPSIGAPSEAQFRIAWDQAVQNQKVFLSFTRPDLPHASKIKEALVSKGYTVFIYLNEETGRPKYDPKVAGRMFREAGLRLVLNTPAAQMSNGVRLEAALEERLRREDATMREIVDREAKELERKSGDVRSAAKKSKYFDMWDGQKIKTGAKAFGQFLWKEYRRVHVR